TAALGVVALACGVALAWTSTPLVLLFAALGALISYAYIGPPFPLAYKGRGLGEVSIFVAFGLLPVLGGVLAYGGRWSGDVWATAGLFGLTSTLVLYHHHFLHWEADLAAGKGSPVALLGPKRGAAVGFALAFTTTAAVVATVVLKLLPTWTLLAALPPLLLVAPHLRILRGDTATPAMVKVAGAAFGVMALCGLTLVLVLFLV
ncbi:MAG: 1,4-dihydroxy-2-naphthoate polyprenyltransferase, partial [Thermoplasmata archaeon]|nr:1,4-dihydroxy-2-naphthoate polyprenyltransferase [Thermoplasmata archaeon]